MDDTDPEPAPANTGHPAVASTSSAPTDESQHADPLVALGERILAELGDPRTNNTLTRWLAHHTARLIHAADKAREAGAPDARARDAEAREAIHQLWQARAAWPTGWPPPRAAEIARILDGLPDLDDGNGWYRETLLAHLQDLHYHVLAVLVDLVTGDGDTDVEQGWLDAFGDQLTSDEASLLRRAVTRPRRIESFLRSSNRKSGDQIKTVVAEDGGGEDLTQAPSAQLLVDLAEAYHAAIANLIKRAAGIAEDDVYADMGDEVVGRPHSSPPGN